ncbi:murein hydrolase regulator LrgA [Erwinia sp. OLTSP20]|uniref:CidA/LrgA family protein n=1 Tax=unclassified Erwinia TaxID=2622719 RepID=UPI000C17C870|nr:MULTISPECIES: CidA/LrgA family protein [unclassified Erwinia]PIJ50570.1 murein hydrolase regulator LrgA [Erwinia sp. OAMSP11]PIJ72888.1 murein hydrolase regulator LrgA [Erwinia sp. OLSSP12]PIJ82218.1 murein hydrolase regulator LrgA [Erwinia sp. OLCASP19]PIJ84771.1 murein hydrolase regulator LrgA [Erwinia sp. OLMTSP26]PIJ86736.1 murein hydrolase regulator LrgA [Erwinia sp. OLMDSP33]
MKIISGIRQLGYLLRALLIIYLCLYAGRAIGWLLPLSLPASIIGMLLLFTLLATQIIPLHWVKPGCHLLIRYMTLLFVPISVGVMNYSDLLLAQFGPIVVSCVISTLIVLISVGLCAHHLAGGSKTPPEDASQP